MVEFIEDTANQHCICKTDKLKCNIIIEKEIGGFRFFIIKVDAGQVPKELSGRYSSMPEAKKAVGNYLRNKKESKTVRRDNFAKKFDERKKVKDATELKPKDS